MPDGSQSPDQLHRPLPAEAVSASGPINGTSETTAGGQTVNPSGAGSPTPDRGRFSLRSLFGGWGGPQQGAGEGTPVATIPPDALNSLTPAASSPEMSVSMTPPAEAEVPDQLAADAHLAAASGTSEGNNGSGLSPAVPETPAESPVMESSGRNVTAESTPAPEISPATPVSDVADIPGAHEASSIQGPDDHESSPENEQATSAGEAGEEPESPLSARTYDGSGRSPNEDTFGQKAGFIEEARQRGEEAYNASAASEPASGDESSPVAESGSPSESPVESPAGHGVNLREYLDAVNVSPDAREASRKIALATMAGENVQDLVAGAKVGLWVELALRAVEANTGQPIGKEQAAAIAGVVAAGLRGMADAPSMADAVSEANRVSDQKAELKVAGNEQTRLFYLFGEQAKAMGIADKKELLGFVLEQYSKFQSMNLTDQRTFVRHALAIRSLGQGAMEATDDQINQAEQNVPEDQITVYWQEIDTTTRQQRLKEADPGLLSRASEVAQTLTGKFRRAGVWALGASSFVAAVHPSPATPAGDISSEAAGSPSDLPEEDPSANREELPAFPAGETMAPDTPVPLAESPSPVPETGSATPDTSASAKDSESPVEITDSTPYPNPDENQDTPEQPQVESQVRLESGNTVWGVTRDYLQKLMPGQDISPQQVQQVVTALSESQTQGFGIEAQGKPGDPLDTAMQPGKMIDFNEPHVKEVIDRIKGGNP